MQLLMWFCRSAGLSPTHDTCCRGFAVIVTGQGFKELEQDFRQFF